MNPDAAPPQHPVLAALAVAREAIAEALAANAWSASDDEALQALAEAEAMRRQADAALLSIIREVDGRDLRKGLGMSSTGSLLRHRQGLHPRTAPKLVDLAEVLHSSRRATADALAAGALSLDHAKVIVAGLAALPDTTTVEEIAQAEIDLIRFAADLDPLALADCAEHLRQVLTRAPDVDDPEEAERLRREAERTRFDFRRLHIRRHNPTGLTAINILIDPFTARTLAGQLAPHALREPEHDGIKDERTESQRTADAFAHLVHTVLATATPAGRARASATVTLDFDTMKRTATEAGVLDDGTPIDPATLRRLLCTAHITPVVLGGRSAVLDVGYASRFFTHHQRKALAARDRGCVFGACTRPPHLTEAHHLRPWEELGPTDLDNGALLCDHHHDRIHREGWEMRIGRNGFPETIPPPGLDPTRRPRQHPRFLTVRRH